MSKTKFWNENEFVNYEEYASFGISGEMRERNLNRSMGKGMGFGELCPFCFKPLKEGSYKVLIGKVRENGTIDYYYNPNVKGGEEVRVGNGCFRHIMEAYKAKYGK